MLQADHSVCQFLISPAVLDFIPFLVTNESTAALRFYIPSPIDVPLPFKLNAFVVQCRKNTTALSFDMTPRPRRFLQSSTSLILALYSLPLDHSDLYVAEK